MNPHFKNLSVTRRRLRIALPALVILASACASTPPLPATNLQSAQQAIANAERVDAGANAGAELGEARGRLAMAQQAIDKKDMLAGARFADEARAEAELAAAKTGAIKAMAVNEDMKKSTATLVEEMQRKTGGNQ